MGGTQDELEGKVKNVIGGATGDEKQQVEGKTQEVWGKAQNKMKDLGNRAKESSKEETTDGQPAGSGASTTSASYDRSDS